MSRRPRATIQELREAVQSLPHATRVAMLKGLDAGPIIAGAYTSGDGICPMLAAHRAGGRCSAAFFADAWDRFAFRDARSRQVTARRVSERELRILRAHLEASLLDDEPVGAARAGAPPQPLEPRDRRLLRRYEEWEAALAGLQAAAAAGVPSDQRRELIEPVTV